MLDLPQYVLFLIYANIYQFSSPMVYMSFLTMYRFSLQESYLGLVLYNANSELGITSILFSFCIRYMSFILNVCYES